MAAQCKQDQVLKRLTINGETREVTSETLAALVRDCGFTDVQVATARNGAFIARGDRAETKLSDGDAIEILSARQGG